MQQSCDVWLALQTTVTMIIMVYTHDMGVRFYLDVFL